jgi:hypothetical protein
MSRRYATYIHLYITLMQRSEGISYLLSLQSWPLDTCETSHTYVLHDTCLLSCRAFRHRCETNPVL